ncbi:hypothetical protein VNO80_18506 [Phaseolus coccineus]|uniref:Uncharacterized protein n=1 Tax=Phaseolus coccineus TaxID=3886 RepID=A0AAN9MDX9_PHACN
MLLTLSTSLRNPNEGIDQLMQLLTQFRDRISQGFNHELQDLVLKLELFSSLETVLLDEKCADRACEQVGMAVAALIQFNNDVFVGQVMMSPTARALVSMGYVHLVEVLCSLIRSIRSPLVDENESNGEIPKVMALLNSRDLQLQVLALEYVFKIGYFGRKKVVDVVVKTMLVKSGTGAGTAMGAWHKLCAEKVVRSLHRRVEGKNRTLQRRCLVL